MVSTWTMSGIVASYDCHLFAHEWVCFHRGKLQLIIDEFTA